ncbi:MAG: HYR domain-containing protein, partial [Flavobacterium sp.]|uniref:HYR domain-containing protein n=1 Tax=Flavobacterium sp. TaxID=239 RepID=UPI002621B196
DNCTGTILSYTVSGATTLSGTGSLTGIQLLAGANLITWTAVDASGNAASAPLTFTKTVIDNQVPIISSIGNQNRNTNTGCGYTVSGTEFNATYSDNCSIASVTYKINSDTPVASNTLAGVVLSTGINTILWTVSDGTNIRTSTFKVTVADNILPTITPISNITVTISTGCGAVVSWTEPVAADNCGVTIFGQVNGAASGSTFPIGTTNIRYRAVDAVGNTTFMSFNVIVVDTTPPVLTCPSGSPFAKVTALGVCFYTVVGTEFNPTTTDGCAVTAVNSFDGTNTLTGKQLPAGTNTIVWTATDASGNISTCTIVVNVTDNQDPTFTQPSGTFAKSTDPGKCYFTVPGTQFDLRNVADNCNTITPTYVITKNGVTIATGTNSLASLQLAKDATYPYSIVWTVSDVNGNSVSSTPFTISVSDNQAPNFVCYGNEIRQIPSGSCDYSVVGTEFDAKNITDNCDSSFTISYTLDGNPGAGTSMAGTVLAGGVHTVVWTVTDQSSNTTNCTFNITVKDLVFPVISTIIDQTKNAPSNVCFYKTVGTEFDPTVTDNCPTVSLVNNQNNSATLADFEFPVGITVVVWTATDNSGNVATMQYQVTVLDVTPPSYTLPATVSKFTSTTSCYYTAVGTEFDPQAVVDNCTASNYTIINNYNNYRSLDYVQFPVGTTNVQWSVKDNYGNEQLKTIAVTVTDNVKPIINCPATSYIRVVDLGQTYYTVGTNEFKPTATDNCGLTSYTNSFNSTSSLNGAHLNSGTNSITWTATDAAGNTETCVVVVEVVTDLYPSISCVGDQYKSTNTSACDYTVVGTEFNATTSGGATLSFVTSPVLAVKPNSPTSLAGAVFPIGSTLVTWTASQTISGTVYTNSCSYFVEVSDNELPVITPQVNINTTTNSGCYATGVNLGTPVRTDNCGVLDYWNNAPSSYPIGTTIVTWTIRDIHNNYNTATQSVTVTDDDAPAISCPSLCRQVDNGQTYYTVFDHELNPYGYWDCSGILSATNNFNGSSTLAGAQIPVGVHTITWTVTDNAGNVATCASTITILDTDPPSVTCRGNATKPTDTGVCTYAVQGTEFNVSSTTPGTTFAYTLSGATSGTGTSLAGIILNKGTTTVTWTATNVADVNTCCVFTVSVYDNQVPVVTWPADVAVNVDSSCTAIGVDLGTATSVDNCDGTSPLTYSRIPSGNNFDIGVTNVYWTAWDSEGNLVYHTQTVTVTDAIAPVITCPSSTYFREYKNSTVTYYAVIGNEFTPPVSDNCTLASYTNNLTNNGTLNGSQLGIGDHSIIWTATDTSGNITTCTVNITIVDSFIPKITCPIDVAQTTDAGTCGYTIGAGVTTYDAVFASASGSGRTMTHNLVGAPSNTTLAGATIPKGTNTITWTATQTIDGTVYSNTCSFDFVVADNIAPVMDLPFDDVAVNVDPGTCTNTMTLTPPTATDNCSLPANITISNNAPATFILGSTNVRWSFIDESGNTTIYNQTVTVNDNEGPVIANCPTADLTAVSSGTNCSAVV